LGGEFVSSPADGMGQIFLYYVHYFICTNVLDDALQEQEMQAMGLRKESLGVAERIPQEQPLAVPKRKGHCGKKSISGYQERYGYP
jgi:hypothetical protein